MKKSKRELKDIHGSLPVRTTDNPDTLCVASCSGHCSFRSSSRESGATASISSSGVCMASELLSSSQCTCHCTCITTRAENLTPPSSAVLHHGSSSPKDVSPGAAAVSPHRRSNGSTSHNIISTLRRKLSQIIGRDSSSAGHSSTNSVSESFRTLPASRSKSSDRSSLHTGHSFSHSRTLPRKTHDNAASSSSPTSPVRPAEFSLPSGSACPSRSLRHHFLHRSQRQSRTGSGNASSQDGNDTLPPRRSSSTTRRRPANDSNNWTVARSPSPSVSPLSTAFTARNHSDDKLQAAEAVPSANTTQDTGYGHTSAMDEAAGASTATGPLPFYDQVKDSSAANGWCLTRELHKLPKYGWYWGPIARAEAEERLAGLPDGAFLLRDSSDDRYLLSLSFRSNGRTLHTRIEHCNGLFSFYAQPESEGYKSVIELIEKSMTDSQSGVFCYSRARTPGSPSFPVRLARPVSRFTQVRTLQYLCRFIIRQHTRFDYIQMLPLPTSIRDWIEETQY